MSNGPAGDVIAVVPAAGHGRRMGLDTPKQYLPLNGSSVLVRTLDRLHDVTSIKKIVVVVGADDSLPDNIKSDARLDIVTGGATRADSVRNGLLHLHRHLKFSGNVLVHDAARPCVRVKDIDKLITAVASDEQGGLLAIPVHDTLKRADNNQAVCATVDRVQVWRAVTPQLFRTDLLIKALLHAQDKQLAITDEASAMECLGYKPRLVKCEQDNIKITEPADMQLAQVILEAQEKE